MSRSLREGAVQGHVLTVVDADRNVGWRSPVMPVGAVVAFARGAAPSDWVECDGRELDGTDPLFSGLYAAIGVNFGGNASTKRFRVPDLREHFIRGASANLGVGVTQADQSRTHTHVFSGTPSDTETSETPGSTWASVDRQHSAVGNVSAWTDGGQTEHSHSHNYTPTGTIGPPQANVAPGQPDPFGDETRPKTVVLLYCIKL